MTTTEVSTQLVLIERHRGPLEGVLTITINRPAPVSYTHLRAHETDS